MTTAPAPDRDLPRVVLSVLGIGVLLAGSLWVLRPFLGALLWATTIVVATWPIMTHVQAALGGRRGAAVAAMTIALLLAVFGPLLTALGTILEHADRMVDFARALPTLRLPEPPDWLGSIPLLGERAARRWAELAALPPDEIARWLDPYLRKALAWFASQAGTFGGMLLNFLLTVVIAGILFSRGEAAAEQVRRFFRRLSGPRGDEIVTLSGQAIRAVAMGVVVTALIQTAIAGIGLFAVGIPFAGFLTAIVLVLCIAQVGPPLVLVPAVIWLYASGATVRGTGLLVATLLAMTVDNVLRPVLIKRGANLSLLLILPGVIGGLIWLGIIGLFIGPVILAVTASLLQDWIRVGLEAKAPAPETASPRVAAGGGS